MLEFSIDYIFIKFVSQIFFHVIGIPVETNYMSQFWQTSVLYSHENEFLDRPNLNEQRKLAHSFDLNYSYLDDILAFNNNRLKDIIKHTYPTECRVSSQLRK